MEQQQQAIHAVGNYAQYLYQMGEAIGKFQTGDVIALVGLAVKVEELEAALKIANDRQVKTQSDWIAEVEGLQELLRERNIAVDEARNDVRNAEAHSEELAQKLDANEKACNVIAAARDNFKTLATSHFERMEAVREMLSIADDVPDEDVIEVIENRLKVIKTTKDNNVEACQFWYGAWDSVREALDVDLDGLSDDEKIERVRVAAGNAATLAYSKRNDEVKIQLSNLIGALKLDGFNNEQVLDQARQIRHAADAHVAQECEWQRRYNELCNTVGIDHSNDHDGAMVEARGLKEAVERGNKQDNYQRKYNQLKGAAGLAGLEHTEAVRIMTKNPAR